MVARTDDDTIPVRPGEDFDRQRVAGYLREQLPGLPEGPLQVRQFPSGASNLTYLLRVGDWEGVLRRPPLGPLPPKAHDLLREDSILRQLHPVYPLAPRPYVSSADPAILGAPFYVMERRYGLVLNDRWPAGVAPTPDLGQRISEMVVATLVGLHAIDWRAAGLGAIGHPEGFLQRQVQRWIERYERARTEVIQPAEPLMRWLAAQIPASPSPTVIHNDFKLNNLLLARDDLSQVTAVLDWEMTTIGDPLFDLAIALSYWVEPGDPAALREVGPTMTVLPGFFSRSEFMQRYAEQSGRDLSAMPFYLTFAYFKWAVIIQQIYARWQRGQTRDARFGSFGRRVRTLIEHASTLAHVNDHS